MKCTGCGKEGETYDFSLIDDNPYCESCQNAKYAATLESMKEEKWDQLGVPQRYLLVKSYLSYERAFYKYELLKMQGIKAILTEDVDTMDTVSAISGQTFYLIFVAPEHVTEAKNVIDELQQERYLLRNTSMRTVAGLTLFGVGGVIFSIFRFPFYELDLTFSFYAYVLLGFIAVIIVLFTPLFDRYQCSNSECRKIQKRSNQFCTSCGGQFVGVKQSQDEVQKVKASSWYEEVDKNPWEA